MRTNLARAQVVLAAAMALIGLGVAGCKSAGEPASSGFASLECRGNSPTQIRDTTRDVFWESGYRVKEATLSHLVAEREGSKMNNVAYGGWIGGTPVWIRIKLSIVPFGEAAYRLNCRAFYVRDIGGATEEEIRISSLKKGSYQKLLDEVGRRLNRLASQPPAPAAVKIQ